MKCIWLGDQHGQVKGSGSRWAAILSYCSLVARGEVAFEGFRWIEMFGCHRFYLRKKKKRYWSLIPGFWRSTGRVSSVCLHSISTAHTALVRVHTHIQTHISIYLSIYIQHTYCTIKTYCHCSLFHGCSWAMSVAFDVIYCSVWRLNSSHVFICTRMCVVFG